MCCEPFEIAPPIDNFVNARLQKQNREKCGGEDLQKIHRSLRGVYVWHLATVASRSSKETGTALGRTCGQSLVPHGHHWIDMHGAPRRQETRSKRSDSEHERNNNQCKRIARADSVKEIREQTSERERDSETCD